MLKQLYIKNYTLIDELDISFTRGFSVITGETGAGKSIILGAIGLLLGQRADSKTIKSGAERCLVEAHFDLSRYQLNDFFETNDIEEDLEDTIIRRELFSSGKSRAFINDTPVPLSIMKELGDRLIDVHSQHQNLLLNHQDFQIEVVDIIANDAKELDAYRQTYKEYQNVSQQLKQLRHEIEQNAREAEFIRFQYEELSSAKLKAGEQDELEQQSDCMTHIEDIKQALYVAETAFSGEGNNVLSELLRTVKALHSIERVFPDASELLERLDNCYIELKDLASEVSDKLEDIDFNPNELEKVNNRLDKIYALQKKYHVDSVEQLIAVQEELNVKLKHLENCDDIVSDLEKQLSKLAECCQQQADILTKKRECAAHDIEKTLLARLVLLGMPHVRFHIDINKEQLHYNGQDKVAFLFSANTSMPLQPISQVASGGEIARVMLSIKAMISGVVKLRTIIFDEIDTGVSGKIAEQMAQIMFEMGQHERQVISITHLPQIAALGTTHYKVYKEETVKGTTSRMVLLSADERVTEIAQMLSGSNVSEAAVENARQLLRK